MSLDMFYSLWFVAFNKVGGTLLDSLRYSWGPRGWLGEGHRKPWVCILTPTIYQSSCPESKVDSLFQELVQFSCSFVETILWNVRFLSPFNFTRSNCGLSSSLFLYVQSPLYLSFPWIPALPLWTLLPCSSIASSVSSLFQCIVNPWRRNRQALPAEGLE